MKNPSQQYKKNYNKRLNSSLILCKHYERYFSYQSYLCCLTAVLLIPNIDPIYFLFKNCREKKPGKYETLFFVVLPLYTTTVDFI